MIKCDPFNDLKGTVACVAELALDGGCMLSFVWCGVVACHVHFLLVSLNPHISAATQLPDCIPNSRADVRLTECSVPCKTTASVKPLSITTDKVFTYSVKFSCPKSKTKDRDTAAFMLLLPDGFSVVSGKSSQPTSAQPVTDANNLVT